GRGDPRKPRRLSESLGAVLIQLLPYLGRQPSDVAVVEISWEPRLLIAFQTANLLLLPVDIALILRLNLHLLGGLAIIKPRAHAWQTHQGAISNFRSPKQFFQAVVPIQRLLWRHHVHLLFCEQPRIEPGIPESKALRFDLITLALERLPTPVIDDSKRMTDSGQA